MIRALAKAEPEGTKWGSPAATAVATQEEELHVCSRMGDRGGWEMPKSLTIVFKWLPIYASSNIQYIQVSRHTLAECPGSYSFPSLSAPTRPSPSQAFVCPYQQQQHSFTLKIHLEYMLCSEVQHRYSLSLLSFSTFSASAALSDGSCHS